MQELKVRKRKKQRENKKKERKKKNKLVTANSIVVSIDSAVVAANRDSHIANFNLILLRYSGQLSAIAID